MEVGLLTPDQIKLVLARQLKNDKRFGEMAVSLGLLDQSHVDELLCLQASHKLMFGEALMVKGYLSAEIFDRELKEYKKEEEKLSSQLDNAFNAIANKEIVKTFTDVMVMMFNDFGQQDIKSSTARPAKIKYGSFVGLSRRKSPAKTSSSIVSCRCRQSLCCKWHR